MKDQLYRFGEHKHNICWFEKNTDFMERLRDEQLDSLVGLHFKSVAVPVSEKTPHQTKLFRRFLARTESRPGLVQREMTELMELYDVPPLQVGG